MSRKNCWCHRRGLLSAISLTVSGCLLNPQPDEPNNASGGNDSTGGAYSTSVDSGNPDEGSRGGAASTGRSSGLEYPSGIGGSRATEDALAGAGGGIAGGAGVGAVGGASPLVTVVLSGAAGLEKQ